MAKPIEIQAPAKVNLFLQVVGKRADGYHELRSLMCAVGIYDTLVLTIGGNKHEIFCREGGVPGDASNLAMKAAMRFNQALAQETDTSPEYISIHLTKRIPVGAGLGGGSSDAAAVIKALNRYYGEPLNRGRLHALALELGADVPFFIDCRPALATGVGEVLQPWSPLPPYSVVVVYPGLVLATAEVFKNLNLRLTKCEKQLRYHPFKYGEFDTDRHLCNDLEQVAMDRFPIIQEVKQRLLNQGALGALMTGSGSAVFGLFRESETARQAAAALMQRPQWQVFATELLV